MKWALWIALTSTVLLASVPTVWRWPIPLTMAPTFVPAENPMSEAKVALGRQLFYDAYLSLDGTMACTTCHEQRHGFADGNKTHPGVHGDPGRRNVPGLANVAWMRPLTSADPRVMTLEAQASIPLIGEHPVEMGMAGMDAEMTRRLGGDACYRRMFSAAFPERQGRIDRTTITMALASFERTLISFDAPVDRGEASAAGAAVFARHCAACHAGPLFTDGAFHALGLPRDDDLGLSEVTGRSADKGHFRTPSLRNVAVTGPWLHDGSATTLADAIAAHRSSLTPAGVRAILIYLDALTDQKFLDSPDLAYPDRICGHR